MKTLTSDSIQKAQVYIQAHGRELEQARFACLFGDGKPRQVFARLTAYQNADGGFGKGLEPDFFLPESSAMATSYALQILEEVPGEPDIGLVATAVRHLEQTYDADRRGWFAVPKTVNDHPHAPWWRYDEKQGGTVIDQSWGNPSAELIGYLYKYRDYVTGLDINEMIEYASRYLTGKTEFNSEHEVYCFIRLVELLPDSMAADLKSPLLSAARHLIRTEPEDWNEYTPQPLHFVDSPEHFLHDPFAEAIQVNLDYLIDSMTDDSIWEPNWHWSDAFDIRESVRRNWQGILTVRNLRILQNFGRIE